ncbi:hypothetical protein C462_09157 [Halorubrum distributum JCM 13916]|uniref:Uncharacterized protein n=1 Tax=Halorubrum distributum JCM 13916 TaxID=1230455 RepID=M0PLM9_9EURY|nr:hypothetical protein C462_09157 [Halorubrum arcis JCM 13916]
MDRVVGVFTVSVNDVFAVELLTFIKRIVCAKSVDIDGERLLLAVSQQEPDRRFICGFCRHNVPLLGATIHEDEHGRLVLIIRSASASREAARARPAAALAAFQAGRDVELVNFNRAAEIE